MRSSIGHFLFYAIVLMTSCGNNASEKATEENIAKAAVAPSGETQQSTGIIGEWSQEYVCFDKNGNYKLEPEEKKPSGTHLGFDWFKFDADGSCQWDKDVKFKGTYEIQEKGSNKKLAIQGGDKLRYTISELSDKELILGSGGAFIVFKRIK